MKNKILRIYSQGWNDDLNPLEYIKSNGIEIIKHTYSNFGGCFFIEVAFFDLEINKRVETLDTPVNKFNWNV